MDNYVLQDVVAGRINKTKDNELECKGKAIEDYIDYDWFTKQNDLKCYICGEYFDIELADAKVTSNMTVDRINSNSYHSKSNCKLCCLPCNVRKRNF